MNIMVMAGTSDARRIIKCLSSREGVNILATATTPHGSELARISGANRILEGRFDSDELLEIIKKNDIELLIDATHPFAAAATQNAIKASDTMGVDYIRFERPSTKLPDSELVFKSNSFEDAVKTILELLNRNDSISSAEFSSKKRSSAEDLTDESGRVFHMAGGNTLHYLTNYIPQEKIVVRVIPTVYSVKRCLELGIPHRNIIAMEGTFSKEFNEILMKEYQVDVVLTKESGMSGGTLPKIQAALDVGIPSVVVMRPEIKELRGRTVLKEIESLCDELFR
ncbi:MAG: precorrin-6A/cobalt-precorrin-6A reductase [Methanobacteriaceae archaeon]|nr:precorrin-6A/cobalt-precorrin-6A reductase [Methanobacteriaceae archaeon]